MMQGKARQQRLQYFRASDTQADLSSNASEDPQVDVQQESILNLELQQSVNIDEVSTAPIAAPALPLSSSTDHTNATSLQGHQQSSQNELAAERGHSDNLTSSNSPQAISTQLNFRAQLPGTGTVDIVMGQDSMDPPLFSLDDNEPLNEPGSLFTEFIKDLIDFPANESSDRSVRTEPQAPFNLWDTFMTTPEDWTDDLMDLDLDFLQDEFLQEFSLNASQHPADVTAPNGEQRRPSMLMGVQAFKTSFWDWVPQSAECGPAERTAMVTGSQIPEQLSHVHKDSLTPFDKHCSSADRARLLELLITNSPKANMLRIIMAFPSTSLVSELMQWALRLLASQTLSWFHAPSFDPQSAPVELLASIIAYGACMTPMKEIQRLGYSILEIVKSAIIDRVCPKPLCFVLSLHLQD